MVITRKFKTVQELKQLRQLACSVPEAVYLQDEEARTLAAAESLINLFTLDYSRPVQIMTESAAVIEALHEWDAACPSPA